MSSAAAAKSGGTGDRDEDADVDEFYQMLGKSGSDT